MSTIKTFVGLSLMAFGMGFSMTYGLGAAVGVGCFGLGLGIWWSSRSDHFR